MGKAQSKRSVDITTDNKKGTEDEVTEKLEKIEDVDKKDVNGEATVTTPSEKKDANDEVENDKDITTEKIGDGEDSGVTADDNKSPTLESKKEDGTVEEISPLSEDNSKKSKKEKVKKKWSFRSISFGKKDKQKPGKTEENLESNAGNERNTDTAESQEKEALPSEASKNTDEEGVHENGNATESEMNGEQTKNIMGNEETEKKELTDDTTALKTSQETEESTVINPINNEKDVKEEIANANEELGAVSEDVKRIDQQPTNTDMEEKKDIPACEANPVNGTVDEILQNGSNDVCEKHVEEKPQIEVNINNDNKSSAVTLGSITSSTSNNPSNDQNSFEVSIKTDNDVKLECDEQNKVSDDLKDSASKSGINNDVKLECDEQTPVSDDFKDSASKSDTKQVDNPAILTDDKFVDEISPPPLPISPPPSQVTVFAFTNNTGTAEKTENGSEDIMEVNPVIDKNLICSNEKVTEKEQNFSSEEDKQSTEFSSTDLAESVENEGENSLKVSNGKIDVVENNEIVEKENKALIEEQSETPNTINDAISIVKEDTEESIEIKHEISENLENCIEKQEISENVDNSRQEISQNVEAPDENTEISENVETSIEKQEIAETVENCIEIQGISEHVNSAENHETSETDENCIEEVSENVDNDIENKEGIIEELKFQHHDNTERITDSNLELESDTEVESTEVLGEYGKDEKTADNKTVALQNSCEKTPDVINTMSNDLENFVGEEKETKEFANPIDLKESVAEADIKQDPSVSCD